MIRTILPAAAQVQKHGANAAKAAIVAAAGGTAVVATGGLVVPVAGGIALTAAAVGAFTKTASVALQEGVDVVYSKVRADKLQLL